MKNLFSIYCTLGPSSLNKNFLEFANKKKNLISLLRLNLSHLEVDQFVKNVNFIKKYTTIPICLDTEGAQIRTRVIGKKFLVKKNQKIIIEKKKISKFTLYPEDILTKLKEKDVLDVGFENLKLEILKKNKKNLTLKCLSEGYLETNKGVHVINRKLKLETFTKKDIECIKIAKSLKIKNFALSFTNNEADIKKFQVILKKRNRIYKIETKEAVKNFKNLIKLENNFLIDRGDLSKEVSIARIPFIQRYLFSYIKKKKLQIAVATNLLESMINNPYPTRAEANDIYNALEMGCRRLVLAGETAIGKNPIECVNFLEEIIKVFKKKN